jgi:putative MATE family efflux protein
MDMKKLILKMSLPVMLSMIIQALYNIVDSIFVAKISEQSLTALSIAFPIQMIIISIFVGLGVGINSFMSRKLGEGNKIAASSAALHGMLLGIILWTVLAISASFLPKLFINLFTDDPLVQSYALEYITIVMIFSFGSIIAEVCMNILRAQGDMISSMKIQLIGAITNIILDPILIFGFLFVPKMGIKGAAIATIIGQIIAMFYALFHVFKKKNILSFSFKNFKFNKNITTEVLKVGIPAMFMQMLGSVMISCVNLILATFSDTAIAVFGAYFKMQSLIYMPAFGLFQGSMPIIGFNYGAKNKKRVMDAIKYACLFSMVITLFGTIILQVLPNQLLALFNSTDAMTSIGIQCLKIISLGFIFSGISMTLSMVFQALGYAHISLIVSFLRQIVLLLPLAYILSRFIGLSGVWIAFPISEIITFIISLFYMKKIYKKKIQTLNPVKIYTGNRKAS